MSDGALVDRHTPSRRKRRPQVWIALLERARKPRLDEPRLCVARFPGAVLTERTVAPSTVTRALTALRAALTLG